MQDKTVGITPNMSVITINVNILNISITSLCDWVKTALCDANKTYLKQTHI